VVQTTLRRIPKKRATAVEPQRISVVEEVTSRIAFEIASHVIAPGERLASVRELARIHQINPSTVQIVLARLRAAGFVDDAFIVRDIELYGGIDTWRYLFRFAQQLPERATKLFENFLSTRRVLVMEVVRTISQQQPHTKPDLRDLRRAVERLEGLAQQPNGVAPEDFARAELQASRVFMRQADQPVLLALYNTIGEILLTVPAVLAAMYSDPTFNVGLWRALVDRWETGDYVTDKDIAQASTALAAFHATCVTEFRKRLI
jgi:GntR family transcriptional regulator, transcriptional repressor for pyruvate dehydrogenase complex